MGAHEKSEINAQARTTPAQPPAGDRPPDRPQMASPDHEFEQVSDEQTNHALASVHKCLRLCDLCQELALGAPSAER